MATHPGGATKAAAVASVLDLYRSRPAVDCRVRPADGEAITTYVELIGRRRLCCSVWARRGGTHGHR